jgi:YrbI family 3-deoxy-D-manno-octulosonate 8-phosphate phosphatase
MRSLAVIPARGGSKGVPRKNLRLLGGKPLIAHTIEQARAASAVDQVVVSTDDDEIADVARRFGAAVIRRPADISGDTASSEAALLHALEVWRREGNPDPDLLVFLQCTSPLTRAADIDGTIRVLVEQNAACSLAVAPFYHFLWRFADDRTAVAINHAAEHRPRRQDADSQFVETGAVYVMRREGFEAARHRFFGKIALYVMPEERHLEIDTPRDLELAEAALRALQRAEWIELLPRRLRAVAFDFDGVMTDDRVLVDEAGREAAFCSRSDGMGIGLLREHGIALLVLSKERNPIVAARCRKLGIDCRHGIDDKLPVLRAWLEERGIRCEETVFVGNDVNDIACMIACGLGVAPCDAHPDARRAAGIVLPQAGGHGAVRGIADLILTARSGGQ